MTIAPSPLLKSIKLHGFLSFGPDATTTPLTALNVLIGSNGSGKSNLVEALSVLRAAPKDLSRPIRQGGGVKDWLWRDGKAAAAEASIEIVIAERHLGPPVVSPPAVRYRLTFAEAGGSLKVIDERVENEKPTPGSTEPHFYFGYENGRPTLNVQHTRREIRREDIDPTQSILSQRRDPEAYPELTQLSDLLQRIVIYRSWQFGPDSPTRESCRADVPTDALSESFDNLPARLLVLMGTPAIKRRLVELLADLAPGFNDVAIVPEGGRLQLYLYEGDLKVPAYRLSDGTLRYLCLLAVLLDPDPAPLVVIEEPELGIHPDVLPTLRDLMLAAAETTQLIVTTHSTLLVDAMTEYADSVLICEKNAGPSQVTRLVQAEVDELCKHGAGLGSLWMSGHLGGTRW